MMVRQKGTMRASSSVCSLVPVDCWLTPFTGMIEQGVPPLFSDAPFRPYFCVPTVTAILFGPLCSLIKKTVYIDIYIYIHMRKGLVIDCSPGGPTQPIVTKTGDLPGS